MTAHWMPQPLREAFGLRYGRIERAIARAEIASLRAGLKLAPRAVRTNPVRLHAERRIAGTAGPHPIGRMMVEIACFLSGRTVTS
jgi:uncharacterized protein (DUF2236 family)